MNESDLHVLEAINPQGAGLRMEFTRKGRRWLHRVSVREGLSWLPILESVEGDDNQRFPPSPPLQQLAFERRAHDVQVAMSVGMAGKNHWSVCVEAFPATGSVRLDVACRCPGGSEAQLVSTYLPLAPWQWRDGAASDGAASDGAASDGAVSDGAASEIAGGLSAEVGNGRYCLFSRPVGCVGAAVVDLRAGRITIRPRDNADDAALRTQRWCYEFRPLGDLAPC